MGKKPTTSVKSMPQSIAGDHALLLRAICAGKARYDLWDECRGEVVVNGFCWAVHLDAFGCPIIHGDLRKALERACAISNKVDLN